MAPAGIGPRGHVWRLTAKKSDFYVDLADGSENLHISLHGPQGRHTSHRFHVKLDSGRSRAARRSDRHVWHGIPRKGHSFEGVELGPETFLVARVRWTWEILRPRYQHVASWGAIPTVREDQSGLIMRKSVEQNYAVDMDVVVSFRQPYWQGSWRSKRDNARLGPLRNVDGHWLTATMVHRWQSAVETPSQLQLPRVGHGDDPRPILAGGTSGGLYWFVETITRRSVIEASEQAWREQQSS